mgnify:CR=1 FL=1
MNGLLRTLIKPDWDDDPKRSKVIYAANLIEVGDTENIFRSPENKQTEAYVTGRYG